MGTHGDMHPSPSSIQPRFCITQGIRVERGKHSALPGRTHAIPWEPPTCPCPEPNLPFPSKLARTISLLGPAQLKASGQG